MVRRLGLIFLLIGILSGDVAAQENNFGAGIILGEPTGLSAKLWVDSVKAFSGALAWSFVDESSLQLHLDYLEHRFNLTDVEKGRLPFYYGIGGRIKLEKDDTRMGMRLPLGVDYIMENVKLDFFFEIVPIMDLTPKTEFDMNVAVGFHYAFGSLRNIQN